MSFAITLDPRAYTSKPSGQEVAAITARLQQAGGTECDAAAFCEHVKRGRTWVGGCFEPSKSGWGAFVGQQLFALDFDNSTEAVGADSQPARDSGGRKVKRPLFEGESGYLGPLAALDRCEQLSILPLCLYFTMGARCPWWPKYRLVFDMGEPLDQESAEAALLALLSAFPEADQACKNLNRLFFGSNGEVWEYWQVHHG